MKVVLFEMNLTKKIEETQEDKMKPKKKRKISKKDVKERCQRKMSKKDVKEGSQRRIVEGEGGYRSIGIYYNKQIYFVHQMGNGNGEWE